MLKAYLMITYIIVITSFKKVLNKIVEGDNIFLNNTLNAHLQSLVVSFKDIVNSHLYTHH